MMTVKLCKTAFNRALYFLIITSDISNGFEERKCFNRTFDGLKILIFYQMTRLHTKLDAVNIEQKQTWMKVVLVVFRTHPKISTKDHQLSKLTPS